MSLTFPALAETDVAETYYRALVHGDRPAARATIDDMIACGVTASEVLAKLVWPTMERLQDAYKADAVSKGTLNLATRLNRTVADQLAAKLERAAANNRKALVFCGDDEPEELGGQICAELFEAAGWTVKFAGGGVPNDEVLAMIGQWRPDLLVMFATKPNGVPAVRQLIDYLREVNSCPNMQILCAGGIYKRAEGLAEEIGADLFAPDADAAVEVARANPSKRASLDQQTIGRTRRIKQQAAKRAETTTVTARAA